MKDSVVTVAQLRHMQENGTLEDYLKESNPDVKFSPSKKAHSEKKFFEFLDNLESRIEVLEQGEFQIDEDVPSNAKEL